MNEEIVAHLLRMNTPQTTADVIARMFDNDGQVFQLETGEWLSDVCLRYDGKRKRGRSVWNEETLDFEGYFDEQGDLVRYAFPDGSAIVIAGKAWDIEGDVPFSWVGTN